MKNRIKTDIVTAMKSKDVATRDILRVLKGEIERNEQSSKGKVEVTDETIISIIRKMIETAETVEDAKILSAYLPKQMSSEAMKSQAQDVIFFEKYDSPKDMGKVMVYFKENHAGTYDGKLLSGIVKELLT